MTDYTELKRLAEAAKEDWPNSRLMELAEAEVFIDAANPTAILALIAENERQSAQFKEWQASHHANYCLVAEERDQLKAEVEALRKDAGRYRWLRDYAWLNEKGVDHMMSLEYPGLKKAAESPENAENKGAEGGLHD